MTKVKEAVACLLLVAMLVLSANCGLHSPAQGENLKPIPTGLTFGLGDQLPANQKSEVDAGLFDGDRGTGGYAWLNFRIFVNSAEGWPLSDYISVLRDIIYPSVNNFEPYIRHFHFFRYAGPYSKFEEEVEKPLGVAPQDPVHLVKFRVAIEESQEENLRSLVSSLCAKSSLCRGIEVGSYDLEADLGGRFGESRKWQIADLIEDSSILALLYAVDGQEYDPDPGGNGGVAGLIHLVSNTLSYQMILRETDWAREQTSGLGP